MIRTILGSACVVLGLSLHAQADSVAQRYAAGITQAELRKHLEVLASDAYEGRETGRKGQKMAATYLEEQFRSFGIAPVPQARERGMRDGYQQEFPVELTYPGGLHVAAGASTYGFLKDYFYFSERLQHDLSVRSVQVTSSASKAEPMLGHEVLLVLGRQEGKGAKDKDIGSDLFRRITDLVGQATTAGVSVVLYATDDAEAMMAQYGHYLGSPRMQLVTDRKAAEEGVQVVVITKAMADGILQQAGTTGAKAEKKARKKPLSIAVPLQFTYAPHREELLSENVLAYVEGVSKPDEVVVVTAHYDHIGVKDGEVYNGADDDGSGTVALLEMAQAFSQAKADGHGPLRSVLFMPVSGEEKGLLGSQYYSEHPVFPLANTVADVNIDMIGRVDSVHRDGKPYVYVIGSDRLSSELHAVNEHANSTYTHLDLDYRFNAESDPNRFYYRSDHYNFAKNGVPSVFFFSGVHEDYHGPKDEVDRIRFDLLEQRTRLVFHTTWELANRPERIVVDKPRKAE